MDTASRHRSARVLAEDQAGGSDCAMLRLPGDALELHVTNVGSVSLPVRAALAKLLISEARPALFGRGEDTLRDSSVRDTVPSCSGST